MCSERRRVCVWPCFRRSVNVQPCAISRKPETRPNTHTHTHTHTCMHTFPHTHTNTLSHTHPHTNIQTKAISYSCWTFTMATLLSSVTPTLKQFRGTVRTL